MCPKFTETTTNNAHFYMGGQMISSRQTKFVLIFDSLPRHSITQKCLFIKLFLIEFYSFILSIVRRTRYSMILSN